MRNPGATHPASGLMAAFVALNLVLAALAGLSLYESRRGHERNAAVAAENHAHTLAVSFAGSLNKMDAALSLLALQVEEDFVQRQVDDRTANRMLLRHKAFIPEFDGLWIADEEGNIRWGTSLPGGDPVNVRDREYFQQAMKPDARLVISRPETGRMKDVWTIVLARRLSRTDGSFAGIVLGDLRIVDYFRGAVAPITLGNRGVLSVRGADKSVFFRWADGGADESKIGAKALSDEGQRALEALSPGGTYLAVSMLDGVERIFGYRRVASYPLYVFVGRRLDDVLAAWRAEVARTVGILLLIFAVGGVYARAVYRRGLAVAAAGAAA